LPHHIRVRTISGQTRVSITGDGVGVCPACRAELFSKQTL